MIGSTSFHFIRDIDIFASAGSALDAAIRANVQEDAL